jgi:hypothetical protein
MESKRDLGWIRPGSISGRSLPCTARTRKTLGAGRVRCSRMEKQVCGRRCDMTAARTRSGAEAGCAPRLAEMYRHYGPFLRDLWPAREAPRFPRPCMAYTGRVGEQHQWPGGQPRRNSPRLRGRGTGGLGRSTGGLVASSFVASLAAVARVEREKPLQFSQTPSTLNRRDRIELSRCYPVDRPLRWTSLRVGAQLQASPDQSCDG